MRIKHIQTNTRDPFNRNPAYPTPRLILGQNPNGTPLLFRLRQPRERVSASARTRNPQVESPISKVFSVCKK